MKAEEVLALVGGAVQSRIRGERRDRSQRASTKRGLPIWRAQAEAHVGRVHRRPQRDHRGHRLLHGRSGHAERSGLLLRSVLHQPGNTASASRRHQRTPKRGVDETGRQKCHDGRLGVLVWMHSPDPRPRLQVLCFLPVDSRVGWYQDGAIASEKPKFERIRGTICPVCQGRASVNSRRIWSLSNCDSGRTPRGYQQS